MDAIVFPPVLIGPLAPTLVVLAAAALVLLLDLVPRPLPREIPAMVALAGMVGALLRRSRGGARRAARSAT
jgi:hypothetical protein